MHRKADVETFDMEDGYIFPFNLSNPGGTCRDTTLNLMTVKDVLNTFNPAPDEGNRMPGNEQPRQ